MPLVASPGTSGFSPNGVGTIDTQHDWYVALSASPDSVGSKNTIWIICLCGIFITNSRRFKLWQTKFN
jgi:hypothetical protein